MDVDVGQTAAAVMPYVTAVVAAYGTSTVDKVRDAIVDKASDATVGVGHRLLHRILDRSQSQHVIEDAIVDVAAGEVDSDAALRLQIRKALAADPNLAHDIATILAATPPGHNEASGTRAIAIVTNHGIASTGDGATFSR